MSEFLSDAADPALLALATLVTRQRSPRGIAEARWPRLISLAIEHGLGPMLWWAISESGIDLERDPRWASLIRSARDATVRSLILDNAQLPLGDALARAGIPGLWLKGSALAHAVYPRPSLRPMIDLDVMVPFEQRLAALKVAGSLGLRAWGVSPFDANPRLLHHFSYHYSLKRSASDPVAVELHFHLLDRVRARSLLSPEQLRWFWARVQPISDECPTLLTLQPEAHLLYLCAHAILQHGEDDFRLLRFLDLHQLIVHVNAGTGVEAAPDNASNRPTPRPHEAARSTLNWHLVVDQAVNLGWTYAVRRALSLTAELFGTPVPAWVTRELRERRPPSEDVYCVVERQATLNRWEELRAPLACLGWSERLRLLGAIAFPSAAHLRYRYDLRPGQPVWSRYVQLWLDQGRETTRWLLRRPVGRRTDAESLSVGRRGRGDTATDR